MTPLPLAEMVWGLCWREDQLEDLFCPGLAPSAVVGGGRGAREISGTVSTM
jgi:hypothetical protein